jgi:hypothetical protein
MGLVPPLGGLPSAAWLRAHEGSPAPPTCYNTIVDFDIYYDTIIGLPTLCLQ